MYQLSTEEIVLIGGGGDGTQIAMNWQAMRTGGNVEDCTYAGGRSNASGYNGGSGINGATGAGPGYGGYGGNVTGAGGINGSAC